MSQITSSHENIPIRQKPRGRGSVSEETGLPAGEEAGVGPSKRKPAEGPLGHPRPHPRGSLTLAARQGQSINPPRLAGSYEAPDGVMESGEPGDRCSQEKQGGQEGRGPPSSRSRGAKAVPRREK